jgi:ActR/RegA family two-component response regulator
MDHRIRILFVDDEPGIRTTLPLILRRHDFEVEVAGSVPEALRLIHDQPFDILISDLNIGQPGDGFTVVSAMRRTQPSCRNMILTGYPGFETALQAIRSQVDDYLVKPASVPSLLEAIQASISSAPRGLPIALQPPLQILNSNTQELAERILSAMKAHPEIGRLKLSDAERVNHIPALLDTLTQQLRSPKPDELPAAGLQDAYRYGQLRFQQQYSITNLVEDTRIVDQAIYDVLEANLLSVDLSALLPELRRIDNALDVRLREALRAFVELDREAA